VKVTKASRQVVQGISIKFTAELSANNEKTICEFSIWEQSWLQNGRDVKVKCDNAKLYAFTQNPVSQRNKVRNRRETLVGGESKIENDDEQVTQLLNEHLGRLDTGSDVQLQLVSIEEVTRQVVAGIKYTVKGTFKAGDEEKQCKVEIWHRAWIKSDEGTKLNAKCNENELYKTRSKRSLHHHHRPMSDHVEEHHDRHHHNNHNRNHDSHVQSEKVELLKAEILFENFVSKFKRRYANDHEHNMRLKIFKKNLHLIEMLNKHEQGTAKYGITEFADLTEKEYMHKTGLVVPKRHENDLGNPTAHIPDIKDLPREFDWRSKNAVTAVKNQGNCGSCWTFSITGNIEGLHAIKTGQLEAYSEQELLDCDTTDNACNGGVFHL
jgi:cathepsin F